MEQDGTESSVPWMAVESMLRRLADAVRSLTEARNAACCVAEPAGVALARRMIRSPPVQIIINAPYGFAGSGTESEELPPS